jgi:hypothetical protein
VANLAPTFIAKNVHRFPDRVIANIRLIGLVSRLACLEQKFSRFAKTCGVRQRIVEEFCSIILQRRR